MGFDLLELVAASEEKEHDLLLIVIDRLFSHRFDEIVGIDLEKVAQLLDTLKTRGIKWLEVAKLGSGLGSFWLLALGSFYIGRIIALRANGDGIFAAFGQDHELFTGTPSNRPHIGLHRSKIEPQTLEDLAISPLHELVLSLHILFVGVKGVAIFHHELPTSQQPKAGSRLVTKLQIDLIKIKWQLLVATHPSSYQIDHHLLMCGPQYEAILFAILEAKQLLAIFAKSPTLLP